MNFVRRLLQGLSGAVQTQIVLKHSETLHIITNSKKASLQSAVGRLSVCTCLVCIQEANMWPELKPLVIKVWGWLPTDHDYHPWASLPQPSWQYWHDLQVSTQVSMCWNKMVSGRRRWRLKWFYFTCNHGIMLSFVMSWYDSLVHVVRTLDTANRTNHVFVVTSLKEF